MTHRDVYIKNSILAHVATRGGDSWHSCTMYNLVIADNGKNKVIRNDETFTFAFFTSLEESDSVNLTELFWLMNVLLL